MRTVTRIVGAVAMVTGVPTTAAGSGNRPGAKTLQLRNLLQDCGSLLLQIGK